jgi:hypothetical protein
LHLLASTSRQQTIDWVKDLRADEVVNHRQKRREQIKALLGRDFISGKQASIAMAKSLIEQKLI